MESFSLYPIKFKNRELIGKVNCFFLAFVLFFHMALCICKFGVIPNICIPRIPWLLTCVLYPPCDLIFE